MLNALLNLDNFADLVAISRERFFQIRFEKFKGTKKVDF